MPRGKGYEDCENWGDFMFFVCFLAVLARDGSFDGSKKLSFDRPLSHLGLWVPVQAGEFLGGGNKSEGRAGDFRARPSRLGWDLYWVQLRKLRGVCFCRPWVQIRRGTARNQKKKRGAAFPPLLPGPE